jgi:hypothetical protein
MLKIVMEGVIKIKNGKISKKRGQQTGLLGYRVLKLSNIRAS